MSKELKIGTRVEIVGYDIGGSEESINGSRGTVRILPSQYQEFGYYAVEIDDTPLLHGDRYWLFEGQELKILKEEG